MKVTTDSAIERVLPTSRATLKHQERILLSAIRLSGSEGLTVKSSQVAVRAQMGGETVTECLRFFVSVGLLSGARGRYASTAVGDSWAEIREDDHTRGRLLLHGLFQRHWSARAALAALEDGPVQSEALAQHLQHGLSRNPRRGMYLVEWLTEALIIHRDRFGRVHAPIAGQLPDSVTAHLPSMRAPVGDEGLILGMSTRELCEMPTAQYVTLLKSFTEMLQVPLNAS
jgi:hypothetical protein